MQNKFTGKISYFLLIIFYLNVSGLSQSYAQPEQNVVLGTRNELYADRETRMLAPIHNRLTYNDSINRSTTLFGYNQRDLIGAGFSGQWSFFQIYADHNRRVINSQLWREKNFYVSAVPQYKNLFLSVAGQWQQQQINFSEISYNYQNFDGAVAIGAIFSSFYLSLIKHGLAINKKNHNLSEFNSDPLPIFYHDGYSAVGRIRISNLITGGRLHYVKQYELTGISANDKQYSEPKLWQGNAFAGIIFSPNFSISTEYNFTDHGYTIQLESVFLHIKLNYRFSRNANAEQMHQLAITHIFAIKNSDFAFKDNAVRREEIKNSKISHWEKRSQFFEERYQLLREEYINRMRDIYDQRQTQRERWKRIKHKYNKAGKNSQPATISITGLVAAGISPDRALEIYRLWNQGKTVSEINLELSLTAAEKQILIRFRG